MRALPQKYEIGVSPLRSERPNLISIRRKPRHCLFWQSIERGYQPRVTREFRAQSFEEQQDRRKRSRHHHALLVGPGKLQDMDAQIFKNAFVVASTAHRLK